MLNFYNINNMNFCIFSSKYGVVIGELVFASFIIKLLEYSFRNVLRRIMDIDDLKEFNGGYKNSHMSSERCPQYQSQRDVRRNTWNQFIEQSTLHGLHYIFEKRPAIQRFIWLVLQGLMCALFLWQTLTLVLDYLEYNVTSTIEFVTEQETNFPAVTLCNFNKYRISAINNTEFYKVLLKENPLYNSDNKPKINWTKYANVNNLDMEEFIRNVGHRLEYTKSTKGGMLYRCTWRGHLCNHTHFTTTLTDMGLCYTFNAGTVYIFSNFCMYDIYNCCEP